MLLLQGAQVGSLVGELRSHKLHGIAKKKKEEEEEEEEGHLSLETLIPNRKSWEP